MSYKINRAKANDILTAYFNGSAKLYQAEFIFINNCGVIVYTENHANYRIIGKIINNDRFQIGNVQYSFTN